MTRDQLESNLAAIGVHTNSYSLDGIRHSDCVCVVGEDEKWKVYYVERDKPVELAVLDTTEEAYDFVYATFCKWLGVKKP
ncbi:hypothetical protein OKW30_000769 [Paraburkholderia sp. Clong3]|uniref:hypothetical protein n=1 Tax=Paraburkholderia sp. Clong3 TaxID=2991061 RepID=UPI003D1E4B45